MASLIVDSFWDDVTRGNIDCDTDTFYMVLTTATYTEAKKTHTKRSDVTNEVTGTGYTAGGAATAVTVTKDTANDRQTITFGAVTFPASTITARKGVIYKRRGGAATADELVAVNDFGADVISVNGTFTVNASTITLQN